ncbi:MAG TPA: extracellular solute-binding protein, partial [Limnochordia bacterium]
MIDRRVGNGVRRLWCAITGACALALVSAAAAAEPVHITFVTPYNPVEMQLDALIAAFEAQEPGIRVDYVAGGEEKWQVMAAGGAAPEVGRVNDDYVVDYALRGLASPLDAYIRSLPLPGPEEYIPFFWDWPKVNARTYAWIAAITPRMFYVNVDLFAQAGLSLPPKTWESPEWTWETFLDTAKKLTVDTNGDGNPDVWGTAIFHDTGAEQTFAVNNGGPGIYSPDGRRFTLADPAGVEAMQWLADLANVWRVHPSFEVMDARGGPIDMFAAGEVAMLFADLRGRIRQFREGVGSSFAWAMRPVPMRVRGIQEGSLDTYVIVPGAAHPEAGFKWLRFLASETSAEIQARLGFSVGLKKAWVKQYFLQPDQMPLDQDVIAEALSYYVPVNKAVRVQEAREIYRPALREVF